ncbi:endothelial lipase-like [Ctenocephalides felis]|nr:endothelial lipase-like [Ctenocephalides felis]
MNIISLDYHPLVEEGCYLQAVVNLETVGHCIADVLEAGIAAGKIELSQLHIIGFSLGAHVAGFIQKYMKSGKLPRVTGLDPALPLFYLKENGRELSKDDAEFVDSIHTNTGLAGKILPVGDIDFYCNGGVIQPGCLISNYSSLISCDHNRAPLYYAESIYSKVGFYGIECSDYVSFRKGRCDKNDVVIMGEYTPSDARGIYYVETSDQKPFALGKPKNSKRQGGVPGTKEVKREAIHRVRKRQAKRRHFPIK